MEKTNCFIGHLEDITGSIVEISKPIIDGGIEVLRVRCSNKEMLKAIKEMNIGDIIGVLYNESKEITKASWLVRG